MPEKPDISVAADLANEPAAAEHREPRPDRPMDPASWDRRYSQADLVWSATPNRFFAAEVAPLAPGRALDRGTGEGRNAVWLAELGWETTGVDFSLAGIEKSAKACRLTRVFDHVDR